MAAARRRQHEWRQQEPPQRCRCGANEKGQASFLPGCGFLLCPTFGPAWARLAAIGNGAGATKIRCRKSLALSSYEEVFAPGFERQKPLFGRGMRFDRTVVQNMTDIETTCGERTRDQQTAMTFERLAFRAHQADAAAAPPRRQDDRGRRGNPPAAPWPHSRQCRRDRARDRAAVRRARRRRPRSRCLHRPRAAQDFWPRTTGKSARPASSARRQSRSRRLRAASQQSVPRECWNGRC